MNTLPQPNRTTRLSVSSKAFWRVIDGKIVIIQEGANYYRELNEAASFIWKKITEGASIQKIVRDITRQYGIPEKTATQDVNTLIQEYIQSRILIQ